MATLPPSGRDLWLTAGLLLVGLFAALAAAKGASSGNPLVAVGAVGLAGALLIAASPTMVLMLLLAIALVIAGLAKLYLPAVQEIRWAAVPLALLLAGYPLLQRLAVDRRGRTGIPGLLWWAAAVVLVMLLTAIANRASAPQLLHGLKGYFQVWGLMAGLALLSWREGLMRRGLPLILLGVALVQLPFVAHQYLVLVPSRALAELKGVVPEDVVGGTFGAQAEGGGANSMLAAYMFVVLSGLVGLWQQGQLRGRWLAALGALLLLPLLLNQAKVSLVYIAVTFCVLFGRDIAARPARFLAMGGLAAGALAAMLTAYSLAIDNPKVHGWEELVAESYRANVEEQYEPKGTFTRAGALRYWADQHLPGDPLGALLGHGVYASSTGSDGAAALWDAIDPALGIKITAVSAILWDAGLLGLTAVFALMGSMYFTAGRLARRHAGDPWLAGLFHGARAAAVIFFVSLWFKSYFTFHLAYQTTFALLAGWLAYWEYRGRGPLAAGSAPPAGHLVKQVKS